MTTKPPSKPPPREPASPEWVPMTINTELPVRAHKLVGRHPELHWMIGTGMITEKNWNRNDRVSD